ncbi:MAG: alkaline phosphatase D family protein, partial [Myxococcota bacterium]
STRATSAGVYSSNTFGEGDRVVQLVLLDLRSFKSPFEPTPERGKPGAERYVPSDDPDRTLLGPAQWQWFERQLQQPAALRVVVSSLQVHADGHGWERWGLLPAERDRLYGALADRAGGAVVIVSGDRHRAGIYERPDLAGGPYPEMTTSSLNLVFDGVEEAGPHRIGPTYLDENFGTLAIDWDAGEVALAVHDITGEPVLEHRVGLP